MIKKLLAGVFVWFCGFGNTVFAQKENYVWYFGDHAGLDFNSGNPIALTNGMISTNEGCATICNSNGNLIFYTDGITVWDKNHVQMPNGDSLKGGWSASQSALIIPMPGNNQQYYIFTVQDQFSLTFNFSYSVVDMTLNSGNGDILIKNHFISSPVTERLTAVKNANNTDIWVMVHGFNNNSFLAYQVTTSGVAATPVISNIGPALSGIDIIGCMKFSPDGAKIAYSTFGSNYVDLFDFDPSTGVVTNEKYLTIPVTASGSYGIEFSPSGNYLYNSICYTWNIFQWDITSNSASIINSTRQQIGIATTIYLGALQLAPDGKIYSACAGRLKLGSINNPELPGILCNYIDSAVSLNGYYSSHGLPNFITSYFLPTGINTSNPLQNQLTISPNPATDKINISFAATTSENITVKIYSITGEVVFENENKSTAPITNYQLPVTNLSNGIYFLSVQTDEGLMTKKMVVNH